MQIFFQFFLNSEEYMDSERQTIFSLVYYLALPTIAVAGYFNNHHWPNKFPISVVCTAV